jgi:hypothetical protein
MYSGHALIHVGQHWHSTRQLTHGERHNLVLWARSESFLSSSAEEYAKKCHLMDEYEAVGAALQLRREEGKTPGRAVEL